MLALGTLGYGEAVEVLQLQPSLGNSPLLRPPLGVLQRHHYLFAAPRSQLPLQCRSSAWLVLHAYP